MGKNSKRRRASNQRQRQRRRAAAQTGGGQRSQRGDGSGSGPQTHDATPTENLIQAAAWSWDRDQRSHDLLVGRLEARAEQGQPVLATARRMIGDQLAPLWTQGWTPADVVHITARRLSARHAAIAAQAVIRDGVARIDSGQTLHPRWEAQLDMLAAEVTADRMPRGAAAIHHAVVVLALLMRLYPLPPTMPGPDSPASALSGAERLDQRMLARVRALLAKAESTEFEEEAEALTAKAQELITRHAIADALLHTADDVGDPSVRRVHLNDPYVDAKAQLLAEIAGANGCTAVLDPNGGWSTVFGYDRDLDAVELLTASLLTQATSAMARHGSRRDAAGRSTTRSFRRSFLFGFATRIGQRLREASDSQVSAAAPGDRGRLLPVLAAREQRVYAARDAAFPSTTRRSGSVSNATGWIAGQAAADQATLDVSAARLET